MRHARLHGRTCARRGGLAAIEAALLFPLFMMILLGLIEYGWLFMKLHQLKAASREGARAAVTEGAELADVQAAVEKVLSEAGLLDNCSGCWSVDPSDLGYFQPGLPVTVTLELTYAGAGGIGLLNVPFVPVPDTLDIHTTMAKEGPQF